MTQGLDLTNLTDEQLVAKARQVLAFFDKEAEDGAAEGDLFGGWDWPTMRVTFPEKVAEYRALGDEYRKRK